MRQPSDQVLSVLHGVAATNVRKASEILIGLVGRAIQSSRSPMMHEREAARQGIACSYILLDFDQLGFDDSQLADMIAAARTLGFHGLNVTHPFKQAVVAELDDVAAEARTIGAVNTIVFSGGRAIGHNTDSWGFAESFRDGLSGVALDRVVQFGAGGAGAAVAHGLLGLGVRKLTIIDSGPDRAQALASRIPVGTGSTIKADTDVVRALAEAEGIVNTTPVGMAKYPGLPFPGDLLQPRHWVADIVYFPAETELLRRARSLGCRTLDGTGMAIGQAARAFELFTGRTADRHAMARHFEAAA